MEQVNSYAQAKRVLQSCYLLLTHAKARLPTAFHMR
jgi:hypothetical protein